MTEATALLHNMSSPPRSTVSYSGLSGRMDKVGPGEKGASDLLRGRGEFGTALVFRLPKSVRGFSARYLLPLCAPEEGKSAPEKTILRLIEARARELSLPDGAVVIPVKEHHFKINTDLLSVLAVLTKCSASVWLRAKSPRLSALKTLREVSLLIPSSFTQNLEEFLR
jgi:hypothetical protein